MLEAVAGRLGRLVGVIVTTKNDRLADPGAEQIFPSRPLRIVGRQTEAARKGLLGNVTGSAVARTTALVRFSPAIHRWLSASHSPPMYQFRNASS
jgi:hypothetical protein